MSRNLDFIYDKNRGIYTGVTEMPGTFDIYQVMISGGLYHCYCNCILIHTISDLEAALTFCENYSKGVGRCHLN